MKKPTGCCEGTSCSLRTSLCGCSQASRWQE